MASPALEIEEVLPGPEESAKLAGLRYVTDAMPGIRREGGNGRFRYVDVHGDEIRDPDERLRVKALAIPPAWTEVWICPDPHGHLQATGRDARGRKQYRYHQRWREVRDEAKFESLVEFAEALPDIRRRVRRDLALDDLPRAKVLAAVVSLLEDAQIRIGNDEYVRENDSYGLTTLRCDQVAVAGKQVRFHFRGKSGKEYRIRLRDRRLAQVVRRCQDLPGQRLFQYGSGNGEFQNIHSDDVNDYLREISGRDFTAKHFRTWAGTVMAARALRDAGPFESQTEAKRKVKEAIESVAQHLGNTVAISRKCYVDPAVVEAYVEGKLDRYFESASSVAGLFADERSVLALLRA